MSCANEEFVRVSRKNPKYFETSDGKTFIPIGLNVCWPRYVDPKNEEEGFAAYESQLKALSENGGNYIRIWLSADFFDIESKKAGEFEEDKINRIKRLLAMAKGYGIRVKVTIEHFRTMEKIDFIESFPGVGRFDKSHMSKENGGQASDMEEFFTLEASREAFKKKIAWFAQQLGQDPTIFSWELWNEINGVRAPEECWKPWTVEMLKELHKTFPNNMASHNLGSYCSLSHHHMYQDMCDMEENDFNQAHRYIDPGPGLDVCRGPMDILCSDVVKELLRKGDNKPAILSEAGAVEWFHCRPSHLYKLDTHGTLLHDALFAPFFAGSAGTGQFWHWKMYVTEHNLWWHFGRFAKAIDGIDPIEEDFKPESFDSDHLRIYALRGKKHSLLWCRDKTSDWSSELDRGVPPTMWKDLDLDLRGVILEPHTKLEAYMPWSDTKADIAADGKNVTLPEFERSIVLRFTH